MLIKFDTRGGGGSWGGGNPHKKTEASHFPPFRPGTISTLHGTPKTRFNTWHIKYRKNTPPQFVPTTLRNEIHYPTTYRIQCCCLYLNFQLHFRFCRFSRLHKTQRVNVYSTSVGYTFTLFSRSHIPFLLLSTSMMMIPKKTRSQWKYIRHNWQ
jgi:hypothetical protein